MRLEYKQYMDLASNIFELVLATSVLWVPICTLSIVSRYYSRVLGYRTTVILGFIGVPVHELSHLLFCKLANCVAYYKVVRVNLFSPKSDGTLGFVSFEYVARWYSPFFNMAIALAPLVGGFTAFSLATFWLRPDLGVGLLHDGLNNAAGLMGKISFVANAVGAQGGFLKTTAWCLISFSIFMFTSPSSADFAGCRAGVLSLLGMSVAIMNFWPEIANMILAQALPLLTYLGSVLFFIIFLMSCLFFVILIARKVISKVWLKA